MALAIDGTPVTGIISGAATNTVVSGALTTSNTDDVIVAFIGVNNGSVAQVRVSSVAGGGLTWTKRASQEFLSGGIFQYIDYEIWWAPAASALTAQAITATLSANSRSATIQVFAVSGANTSSPFSPASTSFKTNTTITTDTPQTTITTLDADTLIFAGVFDGGSTPQTWTTQASFTTIGTVAGFSGAPNFQSADTQSERQIVSSIQTGLTVGYADATNVYVLFVDAIKIAAAAGGTAARKLTLLGAG